MSTTAQIRELIAARSENRNVDYKGPFSWTEASSSEKCGIIKDTLAFSNTSDGGLLIIGVNKDGRTVEGLTQEQARSFDATAFNDFLQRYTDPRFSCRIAEHEIDQRLVISVTIPEFQNQPIICKADANDENNRSIFKRGALYVRTDAARSEQVSDSEMMRELLSRALLRKQNELLRAFEQIVNGSKFNINAVTMEAPYVEERAIDSEFFQRNIPQELQNYGRWIVSFYPDSYDPDRIPNLGDLRNLVQQTTVALRGWNFPHTDRNHVSNFAAGFQSLSEININGRRFEAYRFRLSSLFNWVATYWDDDQEGERRTLSFIGVIYQLTEIFLSHRAL